MKQPFEIRFRTWYYEVPICPYCGNPINDKQAEMCPTCYSQQIRSTDKNVVKRALGYVLRKLRALGMEIPKHNLRLSFVDKERLCSIAKVPVESDILGLTIPISTQWGYRYNVYLLDKLPLFIHVETLAHELSHVWLQENVSNIDRRSPQEIEGFCELVAYKTLQYDPTLSARKKQTDMLENQDPIYGAGLRMMKARSEAVGWESFLNQLRGRFGGNSHHHG